MKHFIFYLPGLLIALSCGHVSNSESVNSQKEIETVAIDSFPNHVIIPENDTNYTIIKSTGTRYQGAKTFKLSSEEIIELNKIISQCMNESKDELRDISEYKRQYVPFLNKKGEKEVWVNCFCGFLEENWKEDLIDVMDGGNCFFNVRINLSTKTYCDLFINGIG